MACLVGHDTYDIGDVTLTPAPLLLTTKDVATALGVSERTVRRLIAGDYLPSVKVQGVTRVRRADLDAYVADLPRRG